MMAVSAFSALVFFSWLCGAEAAGFKKNNQSKISPLSDSMRKERAAPSMKQTENFAAFNAKHSNDWKIRYSPRTALPEAIVGGKTYKYYGAPPEIAAAFLKENQEMLKVDLTQLKPAHSRTFMGLTHLQYDQVYQGLPVEFAYVKLHINGDGEVLGYQAKFEPEIKVSLVPSISEGFAENLVISDLGFKAKASSKLVLFPDEEDGTVRLAWKITARGGLAAGLWIYYVDALSGEILFRYDDLRHACVSPNDVTTGTVYGMVYDISPIPTVTPYPSPPYDATVSRPISNQYVWINGYQSSTITANGQYCSSIPGKVFASLKGPYFSVVNFRGASAHFDNGGGQWRSQTKGASSPHPYSNSSNLEYPVSLTDDWTASNWAFAKVYPRFTAFNVGGMDLASDYEDEDFVKIKDQSGKITAVYIGKRTSSFVGGPIENPSYTVILKTDGSGTNDGFTIDISSYLVLTNNPGSSNNATGSILWNTSLIPEPDSGVNEVNRLSEINAFYHLNKAWEYFGNLNKDPLSANLPIDLSKRVPVMVHAHGDPDNRGNCTQGVGGMQNAFYDFENDMIFIGDGPCDSAYRFRSYALDGGIVRHEYVHLVVNRIYPIINFGEFGAISEGFADYFSLSSLKSEGFDIDIIGNYMDISGDNRTARHLAEGSPSGKRTMPANWWGEEHEDSLILSQALWDLRKGTNQMGNVPSGAFINLPRSDVFAFAALFYFPDNFSNFYDAMIMACKQLEPSTCDSNVQGKITAAFLNHGIGAWPSGDSYEPNNGPEWATDISAINPVTATIYPAADTDYYSIPLPAGRITARLDLPAGPSDGTYLAYSMILWDAERNYVTNASPVIYGQTNYCPDSGDCTTLESSVTLDYNITSAGRYYLMVFAGPNYYGHNSSHNSTLSYVLTLAYTPKGSAQAQIMTPSFDNDEISFSVYYTEFPMSIHPSSAALTGKEVVYDYAQLRDHNYEPLDSARTNITGGYLETVYKSVDYSTDYLGRDVMTGKVRVKPGFANRYPGVGSVYLEIFGKNHLSRVASLGVSNTLNLTTNKSDVTAFNNIIGPANSKSTIRYDVLSSGNLSIKIYTISGTLVKTLFNSSVGSGKGSVDWDGANDAGDKVASGIYFVKSEGPGIDKVEKIGVVR